MLDCGGLLFLRRFRGAEHFLGEVELDELGEIDAFGRAALTVGSGLTIHDLDQGPDQRDGAVIGCSGMDIRYQAKA
jgi:hypothetical protein